MVKFESTATIALGTLDERLYRRFVVPASSLVSGNNVIAVEVHQANSQSTDLFLDLVLRAYGVDEHLRPTIDPNANQATVEYHARHYVGPELTIPDGYVDGGRDMQLGDDEMVQSGREIIVVNREEDAFLRRHLTIAQSEAVRALDPIKRASLLATYVNYTMVFDENSSLSEAAVSLLENEYANEGVLVGEVPRICGAGVCRHRALLFKLLADDAGLDVALVRGNYSNGQTAGGHAWNELHLEDGRCLLFDVTLGRVEQIVPPGGEAGGRYLTVENAPWYTKAMETSEGR